MFFDDEEKTFDIPKPLGPYSPAVRVAGMVYLSGVLPVDKTGELVAGDFEAQATQVFYNLQQMIAMSGAEIDEIVKITFYLTDLSNFDILNKLAAQIFKEPYPARVVVGVASLPKDAMLCAEGTLYVSQ
ncbi:MAG: reactive intermediate/imine deaminase [Legionellales bacterium]|nr:reactive intermediate/imine deaminase [Legionellales bacterium]|tara:strand:- start:2379 stop:2765 length:387 start_codon:yes stop_codon:yes gene_type:complete